MNVPVCSQLQFSQFSLVHFAWCEQGLTIFGRLWACRKINHLLSTAASKYNTLQLVSFGAYEVIVLWMKSPSDFRSWPWLVVSNNIAIISSSFSWNSLRSHRFARRRKPFYRTPACPSFYWIWRHKERLGVLLAHHCSSLTSDRSAAVFRPTPRYVVYMRFCLLTCYSLPDFIWRMHGGLPLVCFLAQRKLFDLVSQLHTIFVAFVVALVSRYITHFVIHSMCRILRSHCCYLWREGCMMPAGACRMITPQTRIVVVLSLWELKRITLSDWTFPVCINGKFRIVNITVSQVGYCETFCSTFFSGQIFTKKHIFAVTF